MEISLLRYLEKTGEACINNISQNLGQTSIQTLAQIAHINSIAPNLIMLEDKKYSLSSHLNWLDLQQIKALLESQQLTYETIILDSIASTNSYALDNIHTLKDKTIVSCNWQFAGRGRFERQWLSTIAHDITVSVIYHFANDFNLALLPIISAIAVNRMLKSRNIANKIKWPNDIYAETKKVAGILVENRLSANRNLTVIGIGLDNFQNWERNQLLIDLVTNLDNIINEFQLFGFALIRREWLDNCLHHNHQVTIMQNEQKLDSGIHYDLGEHGELILRTNTGIKSYSTSAISLLID